MDKNETQKQMEGKLLYYADLEFIKNNSKVLYKTAATEIGVGATDKINEKRRGINGLFTNVYNNDLF